MFGLGFAEILVILAVVLLVMGPEKMPELARTLGRTMWQLKKASNDFRAEVQLSSLDLDPSILDEELRDIRSLADDCPDNPSASTTSTPASTVAKITQPEETKDSSD